MTLKEFFDKYGLKQNYVAEVAGIKASMMRHYVSGTKKPSPETLFKITNAIHEIAEQLKFTGIC